MLEFLPQVIFLVALDIVHLHQASSYQDIVPHPNFLLTSGLWIKEDILAFPWIRLLFLPCFSNFVSSFKIISNPRGIVNELSIIKVIGVIIYDDKEDRS